MEIDKLKFKQTTVDWEESIPGDIWNKYFEGKFETIDFDLDVDKHRWYETSVDVLLFEDGKIFGVEKVSDLFSESMSYSDCYHTITFFEMEEVQTVTYRVKK